jgi:hypothetical protein
MILGSGAVRADGGVLDLRGRLAGGGFKPPTGALAEDRGLNGVGKGAAVIASGVGREDERWVDRPSAD